MNLYWRPGSQRSVICADNARAVAPSRNSSTYFIVEVGSIASLQGRGEERVQLLLVRRADRLEELQCGAGFLLVDLRQGEADVHEDPIAHDDVFVVEQPDVHHPAHAAHVNGREVRPL